MSDALQQAIERQLAHRRAKTDGETPYYAGNEWHADLWRADTELLVSDYLDRHLKRLLDSRADLLAALKRLVQLITDKGLYIDLKEYRAAIARAEGK